VLVSNGGSKGGVRDAAGNDGDERVSIWCLRHSHFTLAFASDRTRRRRFEREVVVYL
jgi:hypothetical protein